MNADAGFDQSIDEFGRGQKVRLIRGDDESSWIAQLRLAQHLVIFHRNTAAESAERYRIRRSLFCLRSAVAALPAVAVNRRLNFGDASRVNRPIVTAPAFDGVLAHPVD